MRYWLWAAQPAHFATFSQTGTFAVRQQGRRALTEMRSGDRIVAIVTQGGGIAGLFEVVGEPFEDTTSLLLDKPTPHRVRVRQLAELSHDDWIPVRPLLDDLAVLQAYPQFETPTERFAAVVRQLVHELPAVDGKVLEFTIHARQAAPLGPILDFVERYVREAADEPERSSVYEPPSEYRLTSREAFQLGAATEAVCERIAAQGFVYAPYEIAAYLTALRTKPFVLLAGPTGVGKSALPRLVAEATGGGHTLIPVRPDWTDSAETLGYLDLAGHFRPGSFLRAAHRARETPTVQHVAVLDEMNLARPEYYLADVLSRLEARSRVGGTPAAGYTTGPLVDLDGVPEPWASAAFPANLGMVGTVNVDESTVPFSRKVLDRAFVLELGTQALPAWRAVASTVPEPATWPAKAWQPRAIRLAELTGLTDEERRVVRDAVEALTVVDELLRPTGFVVGYRSRDEVALFVLHAQAMLDSFSLEDGTGVDPFDIALSAKVLPRLAGGSNVFADALHALLGWAVDEGGSETPHTLLDDYKRSGRPLRYRDACLPFTAARIARMAENLQAEGYAAYWD